MSANLLSPALTFFMVETNSSGSFQSQSHGMGFPFALSPVLETLKFDKVYFSGPETLDPPVRAL